MRLRTANNKRKRKALLEARLRGFRKSVLSLAFNHIRRLLMASIAAKKFEQGSIERYEGLAIVGGIDYGFGKSESVLSVVHGNKYVHNVQFHSLRPPTKEQLDNILRLYKGRIISFSPTPEIIHNDNVAVSISIAKHFGIPKESITPKS